MHPFFQQNPFQADAVSELENDARLARQLVVFLLSTQNSDEGTWDDVHIGATLRNTCHALEALHLMGLEASTGALEAGVAWLTNLSKIFGFFGGEEDTIRLYPSRFKTLACLGKFSNPDLIKDFEHLDEHLDERGLLRDIMAKQLLATIIYVDCLNYLERLTSLPHRSVSRRECALDCIEDNVRLWHKDQIQQSRRSYIDPEGLGDLSYAVDLLLRAGKLSITDEICQKAVNVMILEINNSLDSDKISVDTLYCGMQLANHFVDFPGVFNVVKSLTDHLRDKYERQELRKVPLFFHCLVLRVLFSFNRERLRAEMIKQLLEQERRTMELRRQSVEQGLKHDFSILINKRFNVQIFEIQCLTGGITSAELFRVNFSLSLPQDDISTVQIKSPGSLVVKRGDLNSLQQSITRYRSLPKNIKSYFARHAGDPHIVESKVGSPVYLIMEDLTYMKTFRDIFVSLDRGILSRKQRNDLGRACNTICDKLFTIYRQTQCDENDFFGLQLSRLYIANVEKCLIRMCRPDKFPHLKSWIRGFWLGKRRYPSIEYYLGKIESYSARLTVPSLMLVHGDCHSRNIMLDDQFSLMKLVDLDHLEEDGDYLNDMARLIEDISIFGFVLEYEYRHHLQENQIVFPTEAAEPNVIENKIEYPAFTSEAVRLFQNHILSNLRDFAQLIGDEFWKERLWLALAVNLLFLVVKQTKKKYATLIYVEAIKLLDELVAVLDKETPLSPIPFPGKHPAGVECPVESELSVPFWHQKNSTLTKIHDGISSFGSQVKYKVTSRGRVVQYYKASSTKPFAVLDSKKQPPAMLLACSPIILNDPLEVAQRRDTDSVLKTIVSISEEKDAIKVLKLTKQAFQLDE